jgi:glycosyltransferase involved in cell wall biosynthesis
MSRFRIAHMLPWNAIGGTEMATLRIAQALRGPEFEHIIFCLPEADAVRDLFNKSGFTTVTYSVAEPSLHRVFPFLLSSRALAGMLRQHRISLMHCSDLLAGHYTAWSGRFAGCPVLCQIRGRFDSISRRDQIFLWPVKQFAFVSKSTWDQFGYRVPDQKGVVIYDGIDIVAESREAAARQYRAEFNIAPDESIVGMVARLAVAKDFPTFIRAAQVVLAERPRTRFLIVGDHNSGESYREHYQEVLALIESLGLRERFLFSGMRSDVPRILAALDVFVLSTHREGLPLVIFEAMGQGRPVIATGVDGIPEIVAHGSTGYTFPPGDHQKLAEYILDLLANPARSESFGRAGRELVNSRFSTAHFAAEMASLYRRILSA